MPARDGIVTVVKALFVLIREDHWRCVAQSSISIVSLMRGELIELELESELHN